MDTTVNHIPRSSNDSHMIHVKLARRMQYVNNYMSGNVRPKLLYDAAKKFVLKPLAIEEAIELSTNWCFNNNVENDQYEFNNDTEFYTHNAIYETLLTSDDINFMGSSENGIRFAPAENYTPTSILFDNNCEFLAFPKVFGGYKLNPEYNNTKISYSDFTKSMILRFDRRVAERGDLLLFMAKKLELFKAIQRTWKSPEGPFLDYKISHHYHRIEFQQRGSPHVHILLWLEGAPIFDINNLNTHDEVCQFIDKIISCSSENISDDFVKLQTHKHSHTCQKRIGNTDECRFNIQYFPIRQTLILTPLPNDIEDDIAKKYK
ncbi:Transmembrane cell adhesion receptor mua-3, partial [Frankliniella fusca]